MAAIFLPELQNLGNCKFGSKHKCVETIRSPFRITHSLDWAQETYLMQIYLMTLCHKMSMIQYMTRSILTKTTFSWPFATAVVQVYIFTGSGQTNSLMHQYKQQSSRTYTSTYCRYEQRDWDTAWMGSALNGTASQWQPLLLWAVDYNPCIDVTFCLHRHGLWSTNENMFIWHKYMHLYTVGWSTKLVATINYVQDILTLHCC